MASYPKYAIKGHLSESQIEADVAAYLGWCSTTSRNTIFRLLDVDEQKTGADKLFNGAVAIYIQFKKSEGLKPASQVAPSKRSNRSPLENIREFRDSQKLEDDPTLYFQLRKKAPTASDFQHNILLKYENMQACKAIYVAPLLLDKNSYHMALFNSTLPRYMLDPFVYRIRERLHGINPKYYFHSIPFLREHISIPPHETVTTHKHYYAYSETGVDISWHSNEIISREPLRLSDTLGLTIERSLSDTESTLPIGSLAQQIGNTARDIGFERSMDSNENSMAFLKEHGLWLKKNHGIHQYLLLVRK